MSLHHSPRIVTDGLVLALDAADRSSYPGSGNVWYDLSGNGYFLSSDNAIWDSNGYWYVSNGSNLETTNANISLNEGITLECWWQRTGGGGNNGRVLETLGPGSRVAYTHALGVDSDASIRAWIDENTTNNDRFINLDDPTNYSNNQWYHMVMSYQSPSAKLFMNSNIVDTQDTATVGGIDDIKVITVGAISDFGGNYSHSSYHFEGNIAICRIYNRGLSPQEILQNYNATKSRFNL